MDSSDFGNLPADSSQISGTILAMWMRRAGVDKEVMLHEIEKSSPSHEKIGMKSFVQWTSAGKSARLVSGPTVEVKGERLVTIVRWFINEHMHRLVPVVTSKELRDLIRQYQDLPVITRLQLKRLLHDLEIKNNERQPNFAFATDWKSHFAQWPVFGFVIDSYWCVRASSSYEMALAGYSEEDMSSWGWWHRLTASKLGKPKFNPESKRYSLRGPYSEDYFALQTSQFLNDTWQAREKSDPRYLALIDLLKTISRFSEFYEAAMNEVSLPDQSYGLPIPFFRADGTLLWMLEVSSLIPNTDNYRLIVWVPLNQDSAEYQGVIQKWVDSGNGDYSKRAYFIEDYAQRFSQRQRFALGVD